MRASGTIWRAMDLIARIDEAQPTIVLRLLLCRPGTIIEDKHGYTTLRLRTIRISGKIDG